MAERHAPAKARKPCPFCAIANGTANSFTVYRDSVSVAFLDYRPLALGHVLLIPIAHIPKLDEVPDQVMSELAVRVKHIAAAVTGAMAADGSFIALNDRVSQSVLHVHFHIVPREQGDGLFAHRMIWKRVAYQDEAQKRDIAERISRHVSGRG